MAKNKDELLLIEDSHGYRVNQKVTDKLVLAVPPDSIISRDGDTIVIFGAGCIFFYKTKANNETSKEFVIATLFSSKPSSVNDSTHYPGYMDLEYDKDAYFAYSENVITNIKDNEFPAIKDSTNVELMYDKLNSGKFPEFISYDNQMHVILNNLDLNQHLEKVPLIFNELKIAQGFVNTKGDPYRYTLSGKSKPVSLLQIAMMDGTFSAVTNRDAKTSLMISLNHDKNKEASTLALEDISTNSLANKASASFFASALIC